MKMNEFLIISLPLIIGYVLDLILGDPYKLPHPIRLYGKLIQKGELLLNKGNTRFIKGILLTLLLVITIYTFFFYTEKLIWQFNEILGIAYSSIFIFYGLANKSLIQEGKKVFQELNNKGLEAGRKRLSWIVGRDTSKLNENQIRIAVFETMSENLSDGVIAPLFYYALLGMPGMLTFKMVNTLDSMIGYRNPRYEYFGKFAAKLDDALNFIPARLTAFLMILVSFSIRGFNFIFKYGHLHKSPNAGYPEAALAGILNCRFGGPNIYHGVLVDKPYIGKKEREITHNEFYKVAMINHLSTFLMILTILIISILY